MTKEELILEYICSWEYWMGESWMDYYGDDYIYLNVSFLLGYWSAKFPDLYNHLMKHSNNTVPWKYPQDFGPDDNGLDDLVEDFYYPDRYSDDKGTVTHWDEEKYKKSLIPWVSIIIDNPIYFKRFIDRATDDFENYDETNSNKEKIESYNLLIEIKNYDRNLQ